MASENVCGGTDFYVEGAEGSRVPVGSRDARRAEGKPLDRRPVLGTALNGGKKGDVIAVAVDLGGPSSSVFTLPRGATNVRIGTSGVAWNDDDGNRCLYMLPAGHTVETWDGKPALGPSPKASEPAGSPAPWREAMSGEGLPVLSRSWSATQRAANAWDSQPGYRWAAFDRYGRRLNGGNTPSLDASMRCADAALDDYLAAEKPSRPRAAVGQRWKIKGEREPRIWTVFARFGGELYSMRLDDEHLTVQCDSEGLMPEGWTYVGEAEKRDPTPKALSLLPPPAALAQRWRALDTGFTWHLMQIDESRGSFGMALFVTGGQTAEKWRDLAQGPFGAGRRVVAPAWEYVGEAEKPADVTYKFTVTGVEDVTKAYVAIAADIEQATESMPSFASVVSATGEAMKAAVETGEKLTRMQCALFLRAVVDACPPDLDRAAFAAVLALDVEHARRHGKLDAAHRCGLTPEKLAENLAGMCRGDICELGVKGSKSSPYRDAYHRALSAKAPPRGPWRGKWNAARARAAR